MKKKFFSAMFMLIIFMSLSFAQNKKNNLLTIDAQNIALSDALHLIASQANLNIIISSHIAGNISLHLHDMPTQQAFDLVLASHDLTKQLQNSVWIIMPRADWVRIKQDQSKFRDMMEATDALVTRVWQIRYAKADDIARVIQGANNTASLLSKRGAVHVDMRTNRVCIQDTMAHLTEMGRLIKQLDIPVQQVMISARLASVDSDFERELGINFSVQAPTSDTAQVSADSSTIRYGLAVARLADGSLLDMQLAALEKEGRGELISSPSLFTSNQQAASIESGEEIPYQEISRSGATGVAFRKAVLSLSVTPQILPDHQVLLQLHVNQDKASDRMVLGVPAITTRQMSTSVLVANGRTIVLGGIFESNKENANQRIPFLSKIPLVGLLFQQQNVLENKRELLIFVTPKIIDTAGSKSENKA